MQDAESEHHPRLPESYFFRTLLALDSGDTAFADFEQGVAAWNEAEIDVRDRLPVHPHRTLADQPARLAGGRDKLQLFH